MDRSHTIVFLAGLVALGVGLLLAVGRPMTGTDAVDAPAGGTIAGTYVLDGEDYRRRLRAKAEEWLASNTEGLPAARQAQLRARELEAAAASAAAMSIQLELRADGTFRLRQRSEVIESVGSGTWRRDGDDVALVTERVEGTGGDEPPPELRLRIESSALLVQPSANVPFAHRLVRGAS